MCPLCSFCLGFACCQRLRRLPGTRCYIERNGEIIENTAVRQSFETITIDISGGETNIEIEDGRVRMLPLSKKLCPQGICSHVGWAERPGEAIVCLPNRLVLTIAGGEQEEILDGVAH